MWLKTIKKKDKCIFICIFHPYAIFKVMKDWFIIVSFLKLKDEAGIEKISHIV